MNWVDVIFLAGLLAGAGFILYRAVRKKKWCPAVFGGAGKNSGGEKDFSGDKKSY